MKRTFIMTLVAATFALPGIAIAGGDKDKSASANDTSSTSATYASQSAAFQASDRNSDGFISMEEARGTAHSTNFASLDTNGDGKLSQAEATRKADGMTSVTPTATTSADASVRK